MKFIIILVAVLLAEVSCLAVHKKGGNCGILAGNYAGHFAGPVDDC